MDSEKLPVMEFSWVKSDIRVVGSDQVRAKCLSLADITINRYGSKKGYYRNLRNSHLVGRAGEIAVANVLKDLSNTFEIAFTDPSKDSMADIIWKSLKIDVKTWTEAYWPKWGRCIAVHQYSALKSKASHIIWCTTNIVESESTWFVNLVGWNLLEDVESFPKRWTGPIGKQVYNFQATEDHLRTMKTFFESYG